MPLNIYHSQDHKMCVDLNIKSSSKLCHQNNIHQNFRLNISLNVGNINAGNLTISYL